MKNKLKQLKNKLKQLFCKHDYFDYYKYIYTKENYTFKHCIKCGKTCKNYGK